MLTLAMMLAILVGSLLVSAAILWISARLVGAGTPTFKRAAGCAVVVTLFGLAIQIATAGLPRMEPAVDLIVAVATIAFGLLLLWLIFARIFKISLPRSMLLSVPFLLMNAAVTFVLIFVLTRYCMAAYVIPTNSMAPTLIGWHHEAPCPHCGAVAIISAAPPDDPLIGFDQLPVPKPGICTGCRKISEFEEWPPTVHGPMRLICNLMMKPQRGDVTVFRFPLEPEKLYVQRLVGLPGDKVEIKDDAVWINGAKWTPPPELEGIVYHPQAGPPVWEGQLEPRSWELGPDEFFVLGDFTTNSSDSREWGAVPRANLVGVATVIYWPPAAWRVLR